MIGKPLERHFDIQDFLNITQNNYRVSWDAVENVLLDAFKDQLRFDHQLFSSNRDTEIEIGETLEELSGLNVWKLLSSREEAIERAIMMSVEFRKFADLGATRTILTLPGCTFGNSFGTACFNHIQELYHRPFSIRIVEPEEILSEAIFDEHNLAFDAFILETIRHWDCHKFSRELLSKIEYLCSEKEATLIFDETHTSFGMSTPRTFESSTIIPEARFISVSGRGVAQKFPVALLGYSSQHFGDFKPEIGWGPPNMFANCFLNCLKYYCRNTQALYNMSNACGRTFASKDIFNTVKTNIHGTMIAVNLQDSVKEVVDELAEQNIIVTDHTPWLRFSPMMTTNSLHYDYLVVQISQAISHCIYYQELVK